MAYAILTIFECVVQLWMDWNSFSVICLRRDSSFFNKTSFSILCPSPSLDRRFDSVRVSSSFLIYWCSVWTCLSSLSASSLSRTNLSRWFERTVNWFWIELFCTLFSTFCLWNWTMLYASLPRFWSWWFRPQWSRDRRCNDGDGVVAKSLAIVIL